MKLLMISIGVLFIVTIETIRSLRIKRFWKEWENHSFEFKGFRFNKDYYEVVDGELREK